MARARWNADIGGDSTGQTRTGEERESTFRIARSGSRSMQTVPASVGSFTRDDPRVITALEAYLEALRAGRPWSRDEFLARHAEIAERL